MSHEAPILTDRDELLAWADDLRAKGASIVFTNGVFDLFHAGHLQSLRLARLEGSVLLVAVNSDASVRRLKGEGRPILPQDQRMRVLAAMEMVDCVTCFDEDTPTELIKLLRPEVLAKGGHYTTEQIVGHEIVLGYGGRVVGVPIVAGRSTTNIIDKIKTLNA